mmetsp:Transcript_656/g.1379  ORF Transcript_656/g.1379 Transcript_656/m.1379 type:complete len:259 (+) Transcript_656:210-986(+)|eukprot:CAMPEP_0183734792 /NCGR_PEP_ID=MMETSP0737-20130205/44866_1 /TAXON_ID=385413 /ORGANISM="Thalassiosira miniscula, Strain CCMP1093" /LENGTH=258 /DNA_ID=CAMNT_0025968387 /DNA_START=162 /DNA_END=938 /DNA_ORIENTATION=+
MNVDKGTPAAMRAALKFLSRAFPVVECVIIAYWAYSRGSTIFDGSISSNCVRITYAALFAYVMEYASRYLHSHVWHCKYLWWIHGSHHHQYPAIGSSPTYDHGNAFVSPVIELNDAFAVIFATIATYLMWVGSCYPSNFSRDCSMGIGVGVTLYGFSYFLGHDIVAHERCGKKIARSIRRAWPFLGECARVHVQHHHKVKKEDDHHDPYGPPYGFWLGSYEIHCLQEKGQHYVPMPLPTKVLLWTALGLYALALILNH